MIENEFSKMKWSYFLRRKSDSTKKIENHLMMLETELGVRVESIRCDNAGENINIEKSLRERNLKSKIEFTSAHTPEQNGCVERSFGYLYSYIRSTLNGVELKGFKRECLWAECANFITDMSKIHFKYKGRSSYEIFYGVKSSIVFNMIPFGKRAAIKRHETCLRKMENRGIKDMFVGYSKNHSSDTYRFIKEDNKVVVLSRDYEWSNSIE